MLTELIVHFEHVQNSWRMHISLYKQQCRSGIFADMSRDKMLYSQCNSIKLNQARLPYRNNVKPSTRKIITIMLPSTIFCQWKLAEHHKLRAKYVKYVFTLHLHEHQLRSSYQTICWLHIILFCSWYSCFYSPLSLQQATIWHFCLFNNQHSNVM